MLQFPAYSPVYNYARTQVPDAKPGREKIEILFPAPRGPHAGAHSLRITPRVVAHRTQSYLGEKVPQQYSNARRKRKVLFFG